MTYKNTLLTVVVAKEVEGTLRIVDTRTLCVNSKEELESFIDDRLRILSYDNVKFELRIWTDEEYPALVYSKTSY